MAGPRVAIVDYGMGNLFSVAHACEAVGLDAFITPDAEKVVSADAVILPGVGAFGDAMAVLDHLGMVGALKSVAAEGKPVLGICLGLQLLMERSYEFGEHDGLGLVPGDVVRFDSPREGDRLLKVPQVGWNRVIEARPGAWGGTPFEAVESGVYQYFVHSYHAQCSDSNDTLMLCEYGYSFTAAVRRGNVLGTQFHPEKSHRFGMALLKNFAEEC